MQDRVTVEGIMNQMKDIEKNNWDSIEHVTSIDMLLTSNNNGRVKDREVAEKFSELKEKIQEVIDTTNQIVSYLHEDQ